MKIFFAYFKVLQKKSIRILKHEILIFVLTIALLVGTITAISGLVRDKQVLQRLEVAVVLPKDDDVALSMLVQYASSLNSVKSLCSFSYMDEENALVALRDGKVQAAIVIPDHFYEDIDCGINTPATIYYPKESSFGIRLFQELLYDGVTLLQISEAGIYATYDTMAKYPPAVTQEAAIDRLLDRYRTTLFDREAVFEKRICSPIGEVSESQYYFVSVLMLLLLFTGFHMGFLYRQDDECIQMKLRSYGFGDGQRDLLRILLMTEYLYVVAVLSYAMGCLLSAKTNYNFIYFEGRHLIGLLLAAIVMAGYFHVLYTVSGEGFLAAACYFTGNLLLVYLSGMFVPMAYFPPVLQKAAWLNPLSAMMEYGNWLLYDGVDGKAIGKLLIWLGVFVICGIGAAVRKREVV